MEGDGIVVGRPQGIEVERAVRISGKFVHGLLVIVKLTFPVVIILLGTPLAEGVARATEGVFCKCLGFAVDEALLGVVLRGFVIIGVEDNFVVIGYPRFVDDEILIQQLAGNIVWIYTF